MQYDVVVQFRVEYPDCSTREDAVAHVRVALKGLPDAVAIDAIDILPNKRERMLQHLEKSLGVKKEKIAEALDGFMS